MSEIVCFGDSNTWGFDPATGTRFPRGVRWTTVLQAELGAEHFVIEEGLSGRTADFDDPLEPGRRGSDYLPACLRSHNPLDVLILALGCNDMKARFDASAAAIAAGMERLIAITRTTAVAPSGEPPAILIVAPPPLAHLSGFAEMFAGAEPKSAALPGAYAELAERLGVGFVDSGQFIRASDLDGIHYEADQHLVLGRVMAEAVKMVLA